MQMVREFPTFSSERKKRTTSGVNKLLLFDQFMLEFRLVRKYVRSEKML